MSHGPAEQNDNRAALSAPRRWHTLANVLVGPVVRLHRYRVLRNAVVQQIVGGRGPDVRRNAQGACE